MQTLTSRLLLALALLAGQWAGQLHELSHAQYDLVTTAYVKAGGKGTKPVLDHAREHCVAFQGLDCSPSTTVALVVADVPTPLFIRIPDAPAVPVARPPFSSRAPPAFS